jgi:DNA-directed RNA polymerase subunit RPC12/RpoP
MDIEQYLKIEFEVYPRKLRDVAAYLAKSDAIKEITKTRNVIQCTGCGKDSMNLRKVALKGGSRYHYVCSSCGKQSANPHKTAYLAYWDTVSSTISMSDCLLVDKKLFEQQMQKWSNKNIAEQHGHLMLWNASLTWLKWVWKQHRLTPDYTALSENDAMTIDAIGFIIEGFRKGLKKKMEFVNIDFYDALTQKKMKDCDMAIKFERKRYYPQYQSGLSPVFRYKIKEQLAIG